MSHKIDFSTANAEQIIGALGERLEQIRLSRNITQKQLAKEAGLSTRTLTRLEKGQGVSFDTFIRALSALGIQQNLAALLPDPSVRPVERVLRGGKVRQRARAPQTPTTTAGWRWGDDDE